jgi:hypothetical protein
LKNNRIHWPLLASTIPPPNTCAIYGKDDQQSSAGEIGKGLRITHIDMDAVLSIFFVFALGFQNKFLENIVVTSDHTVNLCQSQHFFGKMSETYLIFKSDP